jgi:ApaG protein
MSPHIAENISIQVEPVFLDHHSDASKPEFLFSYHIRIANLNPHSVQLLSRHWYIFDSNGQHQEVQGEGVVGKQPIIEAEGTHEYQSFCRLETDMGMMWGVYLMRNCENEQLFEVKVPEFQMIDPARLN